MPHAGVEELLELMARLRAPDGCPWDREQTFRSIAPYTIEEAYEVDDAIRREHWPDLREELGDLLLQVVFHAQMASEAGRFDFADVVRGLCEKLVRRHPHVFGGASAADADEVLREWEKNKRAERAARGEGALDGVPRALPGLLRAAKLAKRAARGGEGGAIHDPIAAQADAALAAAGTDRLGDFLFAVSALAGARGVDAEDALREACARFEGSD